MYHMVIYTTYHEYSDNMFTGKRELRSRFRIGLSTTHRGLNPIYPIQNFQPFETKGLSTIVRLKNWVIIAEGDDSEL